MTNQFPKHIQKAIRTYSPVEFDGITLYPICMDEFDEFQVAAQGIEVLQRSLPVKYLSMPLLSALYALEYDTWAESMESGETAQNESVGLFGCAALFLILACRIGKGRSTNERRRMCHPVWKKENPRELTSVILIDPEDGRQVEITPVLFQRLRPVLAAQNGIKLVSDNANPDLVEAERDMHTSAGIELDASVEALVTSVATLSRVEEEEIYRWPIAKLFARKDALQRAAAYFICGVGETQGAKWKGGNPYPNLFFERTHKGMGGLVEMKSVTGKNQVSTQPGFTLPNAGQVPEQK